MFAEEYSLANESTAYPGLGFHDDQLTASRVLEVDTSQECILICKSDMNCLVSEYNLVDRLCYMYNYSVSQNRLVRELSTLTYFKPLDFNGKCMSVLLGVEYNIYALFHAKITISYSIQHLFDNSIHV